MDKEQLRRILEGAIMAAGQPLNLARLMSLFEGDDDEPSKDDVRAALEEIQANCAERGFELKEVASGWRFQVREDNAPWVNRLWEEKPQKYSRALLETLALIAYRQPITRGDIEEIRGVAVSSHIIKTLSEREWIKVVGHRDVPGRPSLFATTRQFLDYFNIKSLEDLPSLGEIRDLDELNKSLDLGEEEMAAVKQALIEEAAEAQEASGEASPEQPEKLSQQKSSPEQPAQERPEESAGEQGEQGESASEAAADVAADADVPEAAPESGDSADELSDEAVREALDGFADPDTAPDLDPDFDDSFEAAEAIEGAGDADSIDEGSPFEPPLPSGSAVGGSLFDSDDSRDVGDNSVSNNNLIDSNAGNDVEESQDV